MQHRAKKSLSVEEPPSELVELIATSLGFNPKTGKEFVDAAAALGDIASDRCKKTPGFFGAECAPDGCRYPDAGPSCPWPATDFRCPANMRDMSRYWCLAFGRMDFFLVSHMHPRWGNAFRERIGGLPQVEGVMALPALRVRHSFAQNENERESESRLPFGLPGCSGPTLVSFACLELPVDLLDTRRPGSSEDGPKVRGRFLAELADQVLGWEQEPSPILLQERLSADDIGLEMLLSFSSKTFPVILKSEHATVESLVRYARALEGLRLQPGIRDWHMLLGYRPGSAGAVLRNDARAAFPGSGDKWKGLTFHFLVRFHRGPNSEDVTEANAKLGSIRPPPGVPDPPNMRDRVRLAEWHYVRDIVCDDVAQMVQAIVEVNQLPSVERTALVPSFPSELLADPRVSKPDRRHREAAKNERQSTVGPEWNYRALDERVASDAPHMLPALELALATHHAPPASGFPRPPPRRFAADEILNRRLYDIESELQWLQTYLRSLRRDWEHWWESRGGGSAETDGRECFERLDRILAWDLGILRSYPARVETVARDDAECLAEASTLPRGQQASLLLQRIAAHDEFLKKAWAACGEACNTVRRVKNAAATLLTAYRDRCEGTLVVTPTEPMQHLTDQNGVGDGLQSVALRLMRDYVARAGHPAFSDEVKTEGTFKGGIATFSSTEAEFKIVPDFRLLHLPPDLRFNTQDKLVILAHEAAHFVLWLIGRSRTAKKLLEDALKPLWERAFALLQWENGTAAARERLAQSWAKDLWRQELLCDILAALAAGPAYHACLFHYLFRTHEWPNLTHPPGWIRFRTALALARAMGWDADDPWTVYAPMAAAIRRHYASKEGDDRRVRCFHHHVRSLVEEPTYWLMRSLDDPPDPRSCLTGIKSDPGTLLLAICHVASVLSPSYLFYPFASDPAARETVRCTENDRCRRTMHRLMNGELVLNEPPRVIAAASMIWPYGRPYHAGGQVLLSILNTEVSSSFAGAAAAAAREERGAAA